MKWSALAVSAAAQGIVAGGALALSGVAMAQSSVTLFGIADVGLGKVEYLAPASDANAKKVQMRSGTLVNNATSHVGVRGVEDLGGGLKAGFNFETNLNLEDGNNMPSGGGFWGRSARLYLEGPWGEVELGRTYAPSFLAMINWQLTRAANYSVVGWTYDWGGAGVRNSSLIGYKTPTFGNFHARLGYVMKADNGGLARWDTALNYAGGPLVAALTVNKTQNAKVAYSLGGQYRFGNFALAASYNQAARAQLVRRGVSLGAQAAFGAATVTFDVARDLKNEWVGKKYTNALLEGRYALSKRTFAYAAIVRLDGTNNYGLGVRHSF